MPVEIDNVIHQVYVLKRPYVDEFLLRMGELFECVLFTASLAKVRYICWKNIYLSDIFLLCNCPYQLGNKFPNETILNIWRNEKYFSVLLIYQLFGYNLAKIQLTLS